MCGYGNLLHLPHDHTGDQLLWTGHDRFAVEEYAHVVQFQRGGRMGQRGRVVDGDTILLEQGVLLRIAWGARIDRYVEEFAASAAHRVERDSQRAAATTPEMRS